MHQNGLRRIEFVTRKFTALQGLRTILSTGSMMAGTGFWVLGRTPSDV